MGYETVGSRGYVDSLRALAISLGVADRVEFRGSVPRRELMEICAASDIGLALLPHHTSDVNMISMWGASNKVFDYMACGLVLVMSDQRDWAGPLVEAGCAAQCDPTDANSLAGAIRLLIADPI